MTDIDIYHHLNDILRHVYRLINIKFFLFSDTSTELMQIHVHSFKNLVPLCKKLKKIKLFVTIDNFDLWQTFRHFDALKELNISCSDSFGSVLIDTKTWFKPLPKLKNLVIKCQSIGNNFFIDVTQFIPNLEILNLTVYKPRYRFTNQYLIALSECKKMKNLWIYLPPNRFYNEINPSGVDDIGLIPLIENCKQLKRIRLEYEIESIINSLTKWIEVIIDSTKTSITFEWLVWDSCIDTVLSDMSRLKNLKSLKIKKNNRYSDRGELIRVKFEKLMTISVTINTKIYFEDMTEVWQTLCRYKDLERLEFRFIVFNSYKSMPNIEPLIELKEITFECRTINKHFFDNITKLAPNVEELELKSDFELTNDNLITISKLICLTRICLVSYKKKNDSVDDIGVIQFLDKCQKLRLIILDLEVNITSVSIEKLIELAKQRSDQLIRFECFVSSPELQSNRLKNLPKNLIIQTQSNRRR